MLNRTVTIPVHAVLDGKQLLEGEARVQFRSDHPAFALEAKRLVAFEIGGMSLRFAHEDLRDVLRESDHVAGVQHGA